jgi:hypothetical protein
LFTQLEICNPSDLRPQALNGFAHTSTVQPDKASSGCSGMRRLGSQGAVI